MESRRAYLFVETPFSWKNKRTLLFAAAYLVTMLGLIGAICFLHAVGDFEIVKMLIIIAPVVICMETIAVLFLLRSYLTAENGALICKYAGLFARHIPKGAIDCVKREQGNLVLHSRGQQVLTIIDSAEARNVLELAHIHDFC